MSNNITGPRVLGGYTVETMQTPEGRAAHVRALCAALQRSFAAHGKLPLQAWIWAQQNPHGEAAPAILAVELAGEVDEARLDAFTARVTRACELGKALAVATVTEHRSVEIIFESLAGTEVYSAEVVTTGDPLNPTATRRTLGPFSEVTSQRAPARFLEFLPRVR